MAIPFLYQLQNSNYTSLNNTDFRVAVIDMDDAGLSKDQITQLQTQDKTLFTYISIGEAEDYRDYISELLRNYYHALWLLLRFHLLPCRYGSLNLPATLRL